MYFAISHIFIEVESHPSGDSTLDRDLKQLAEKIRSRFKVCAAYTTTPGADANGIAVAALGPHEERLSRQLDAIVEFCEQSGIGRVINEQALIDHIDNIDHNDQP